MFSNNLRHCGHILLLVIYFLLIAVLGPICFVLSIVFTIPAFLLCCACKKPKMVNLTDPDQETNVDSIPVDEEIIKSDEVDTICIIGAGIAGVQVARSLRNAGKNIKVYEKEEWVGGVWRANYADYALQVPGELFEFPEFPFKHAGLWNMRGNFPSGPHVQAYIEKYVLHENLKELITFNTQVVQVKNLEINGEGKGWEVTTKNMKTGEESSERFSFVCVATGMYSNPNIPTPPGAFETFDGEIIHSSKYYNAAMSVGKRVVVVGGGKSAVDIAVASSRESVRSTLLPRKPHWPVPRYLFNLIPFKYATYSRFGHLFLPQFMDSSMFHKVFHVVGYPLIHVFWRFVEEMITVQYKLLPEQIPTTPIQLDLFTGGLILNYNWKNILLNGGADLVPGTIEKYEKDGVVLTDGSKILCDQVVYATGFKKNYDYIVDAKGDRLFEKQSDGYWLYMHMINPDVPNIAFVGSEVSTFSNILTHTLQTEWLVSILKKKRKLPSQDAMREQLKRQMKWKRDWMPKIGSRSAILQLHMLTYHDELLRGLGESPYRKIADGCMGKANPWNWFKEAFGPYTSQDYMTLIIPDVPVAMRNISSDAATSNAVVETPDAGDQVETRAPMV